MKIKKAYARTRVQTVIPDDRKTKAVQSEKTHSDINNIVAKAYKTGQLPVLTSRQPIPKLPEAGTYQDMLNKVVFANQQFERLPSSVRAEFENKPQNMLHAIELSKDNAGIAKRLVELGLIDPPPSPKEPSQSAPQNAGDGKAPSPEGGK